MLNIVLKNTPGFSMDTSWGQTYRRDGDVFTHSMHGGFANENGAFMNLTFETSRRGHTNRAGAWGWPFYNPVDCGLGDAPSSTGFCLDPRERTVDRHLIQLGDAETDHYTGFYNASLPLGENVNFYSFGGYSTSDNSSPGFYRVPFIFSPRIVYEIHPEGFLPFINTDVDDLSVAAGIDWTTGAGWAFDLSVNHGRNDFNFLVSNSNNASYGVNSPTAADAGGLRFDQTTFNFDVARLFEYDSRTMNLAFGGEFRRDGYGIRAGEPVSYLHCLDDPNSDKSACRPDSPPGIQVFPGYRPSDVADASRINSAAYADLEWVFGSKFLAGVAGRLERYSDFGSTINGKLSLRYDFTPAFAVRGGINTGFRAPSLHQLHYSKIDTLSIESDEGTAVLAEVGTFPNNSAIVQALDVPPLKHETAVNFSGGIVAQIGDASALIVDAFRVQVDDRIVLSANFSAADVEATAPTVAQAMRDTRISGAQFFRQRGQDGDERRRVHIQQRHLLPRWWCVRLGRVGILFQYRSRWRPPVSGLAGVDQGGALRARRSRHTRRLPTEYPSPGHWGVPDRTGAVRRGPAVLRQLHALGRSGPDWQGSAPDIRRRMADRYAFCRAIV